MKIEEKKAKDAARRGGSVGQARSVAARSRANPSGSASAATRPGVVSVSAEEAQRLDDRIAEKQQRNAAGGGNGNEAAAAASAAASKPCPKAAPKEGITLQADVEAKQRGRESVAAFATTATKRGALCTVARSGSGRQELDNLKTDAPMVGHHKPSARDDRKSPPVASLEDRIAAKVKRETSGSSMDRVSVSTPGARSEIGGLEDSVAAKIRGGHATPGPAVLPGAYAEDKTALEETVTAKVRRESSGVTGAPVAPTTTLGAQTTSTTSAAQLGGDRVAHLDARIAAKTASMAGTGPDTVSDSKAVDEKAAAMKDRDAKSPPKFDYLDVGDEKAAKGDEKGTKFLSDDPEQALASGPGGAPTGGSGVAGNGLAIAVAVDEDPDDVYIPSAIEYDPDSKPPLTKNRRFRLYAFLVCAVVVLVAVGAAIAVTLARRDGGADIFEPTAVPTSYRESLGIKAQIRRVVGGELLEDPESPYAKALEWITFEDPMQQTPDDETFIQRYVTAYFYYATTESGPWRSCNPPSDPSETRCDFANIAGIFPLAFSPVPWHAWLSNITECEWAGVLCDENSQIRAINLPAARLSGTFPEGIYHLPFLQSFEFYWNDLRGTLPKELVEMKHLVDIQLHFNVFTGTVPEEWWTARNLQRWNIGDNMLSGTIPSSIGALKDLKDLYLFTNFFTGTFPTEIGLLESLTYIRSSRTDIEGELPTTIVDCRWLQEFWMHACQMSGTLPQDIGKMTNVLDFRFHTNSFNGTFPDSMYDLIRAERLDLYDNSFEGTISPKIGKLAEHLNTFRVSYNKLHGSLPQEFGLLSSLTKVTLEGNSFTGTVPQSVCYENADNSTGKLVEFEGFVADCAPNDQGISELGCMCCTECCNSAGVDCFSTSEPRPNFEG